MLELMEACWNCLRHSLLVLWSFGLRAGTLRLRKLITLASIISFLVQFGFLGYIGSVGTLVIYTFRPHHQVPGPYNTTGLNGL
jgi:hypothetical protein